MSYPAVGVDVAYSHDNRLRLQPDGGIEYRIADHLGSNRVTLDNTGSVVTTTDYAPFGGAIAGVPPRKGFIDKEKDKESNLGDFGVRKYDDGIGRFLSIDPLTEKMPSWSPYVYSFNSPLVFVDQHGKEPIKPLVGTVTTFRTLLDNSPRKVGTFTSTAAHNYMLSLGNTKFSWKQMRLLPTQTGYFNNKEGRYIYTKKGGWVDMAHFMFYAGKAYKYKQSGVENPIGEAVQDGYRQEFTDQFLADHSAYSYEDLPSDKYGADFAVNYFDPKSDKTFGEQLQDYLNNILKATDPGNAPNYEELPETYPDDPSRINKTTDPVYTEYNP